MSQYGKNLIAWLLPGKIPPVKMNTYFPLNYDRNSA